MPCRLLLSVGLAALSLSSAGGAAVDGSQAQAMLGAADPALNMVDILDSAPAIVYNNTVLANAVARQAMEDSTKEFNKINLLLDKQIQEQEVKVMAAKIRLQQAVACVKESSAQLVDIKHREDTARAELAKLQAESGITTPAAATTAHHTTAKTAPHAESGSVTTAAASSTTSSKLQADSEIVTTTPPAKTVVNASSFVQVQELQSAGAASASSSAQRRALRGTQALARASASDVLSSLQNAFRRQTAEEERVSPSWLLQNHVGERKARTTAAEAAGMPGCCAQAAAAFTMTNGAARTSDTPDGGAIGGYSRLENVRSFLTSATAASAASRLPMPSIGALLPFLLGGGDGNGDGGFSGGGRGGGAGNGGLGINGLGGGPLPGEDPSGALKEALIKAVARVEAWLSAVTAQSQALRNRRDGCTVHVDEMTTLLQSQRTFLALLKKRKEYEAKVYRAQQANDQSMAEFAQQEQAVLLDDLVRFHSGWNAQHAAKGSLDLQLPPVVLPDWDEYSNTVALADEGPAHGGGSLVALGGGALLPGRKGPRTTTTTASPTPPASTTEAAKSTEEGEPSPPPPAAVPTTTAPRATAGPAETTTPEPETTDEPDEATTSVPPLLPAAAAAAAEQQQQPPDTPLVSNEAPNIGPSKPLQVSRQVKAWADINETAAGNSPEYSAFDISNSVFGADGGGNKNEGAK
jgi:hypothetical protein